MPPIRIPLEYGADYFSREEYLEAEKKRSDEDMEFWDEQDHQQREDKLLGR